VTEINAGESELLAAYALVLAFCLQDNDSMPVNLTRLHGVTSQAPLHSHCCWNLRHGSKLISDISNSENKSALSENISATGNCVSPKVQKKNWLFK
jgi:hypothetical protein